MSTAGSVTQQDSTAASGLFSHVRLRQGARAAISWLRRALNIRLSIPLRAEEFFDFPEITPAERETLLRLARALDEAPPERVEDGPKQTAPSAGGLRPGEDYNQRGNVRPFLLKAGAKPAGGNDDREQWTRPGKEKGISLTLYDGRTVRVFSSNFPPFEQDKNYSAFVIASYSTVAPFSPAPGPPGRCQGL